MIKVIFRKEKLVAEIVLTLILQLNHIVGLYSVHISITLLCTTSCTLLLGYIMYSVYGTSTYVYLVHHAVSNLQTVSYKRSSKMSYTISRRFLAISISEYGIAH